MLHIVLNPENNCSSIQFTFMIYHTSTPDEIAYLLPVFAKNKRRPSIRKENSYYIYNTKSKEIFDFVLPSPNSKLSLHRFWQNVNHLLNK